MYAGAGLTQAVWDRLEAIALRSCGERIRSITGLGMTEASPSCTFALGPVMRAGHVGLPVPGCRMKLVPVDGKLEARFAGPRVSRSIGATRNRRRLPSMMNTTTARATR